MRYETKFGLGDRIYAIGQPEKGCACAECLDDPGKHKAWNVLGVSVNRLERFDPLTIEAVMILPDTDNGGYEVVYAVREMPGELLSESHCYQDLHEAGQVTEALNGRPEVSYLEPPH